MRGERLKHTINLFLRKSSSKRMKYLKSHHVFAYIGENSTFMGRIVPLYSRLIKIGSNVRISSKVSFICHDTIHIMLNRRHNELFQENIGCIEIGDNVFVGAGTTILYNVKVGSNVIIGAGSLVNKDIPDNSVVAGVPARVIGSLDDYISNRRLNDYYPKELAPRREAIKPELEKWCWEQFYRKRDSCNSLSMNIK